VALRRSPAALVVECTFYLPACARCSVIIGALDKGRKVCVFAQSLNIYNAAVSR